MISKGIKEIMQIWEKKKLKRLKYNKMEIYQQHEKWVKKKDRNEINKNITIKKNKLAELKHITRSGNI